MMDKSFSALFELSRRMKSRDGKVLVSSSELGSFLGVSQQSASRYLLELERDGLILRVRSGRGQVISFTDRGLSVLESVFLELKSFFECSGSPLVVEGRVSPGFGEGAYYVKEYVDLLEEHLGFRPFYGTLNVKPVHPCPGLERHASGFIPSFERDGRSFGALSYVPARVEAGDWSEPCFLVLPQRTHHKNELEVVCKTCLRKKHGLKDGDLVKIIIG